MALKSNRVGVRTDQVDAYGRVISKSFFQSILDHLPRWTSLKVWKNGTEQLLPVNTDEPVTSPIVADIQYPTDSSATEQMFTYRESPTDADGEAYIQNIKGNTIVWNQLVQNGNFADTSKWIKSGSNTLSVNSNIGTLNCGDSLGVLYQSIDFKSGHKYLYYETVKADSTISNFIITIGSQVQIKSATIGTSWSDMSGIFNYETDWSSVNFNAIRIPSSATGHTIDIKNCMLIDLTAMFGSAKADEILAMETAQAGSGVEYFKSLFPLPYYKYDAGSLLSFNGTGIKTVGFNQWDEEWKVVSSHIESKNPIPCFPNIRYYLEAPQNPSNGIRFYDANMVQVGTTYYNRGGFYTPNNASFMTFAMANAYGTTYNNDICINISSSENGKYEPYTTSTTIIPTDTYFPTGMKSAGTVYDEFVSSRAYTRIGEVDLGSLTWEYQSGNQRFRANVSGFAPLPSSTTVANIKCSIYTPVLLADTVYSSVGKDMVMAMNTAGAILHIVNSSYTDATAFKTAMDGVMLYYELAEEIIEPTLEFDEE